MVRGDVGNRELTSVGGTTTMGAKRSTDSAAIRGYWQRTAERKGADCGLAGCRPIGRDSICGFSQPSWTRARSGRSINGAVGITPARRRAWIARALDFLLIIPSWNRSSDRPYDRSSLPPIYCNINILRSVSTGWRTGHESGHGTSCPHLNCLHP